MASTSSSTLQCRAFEWLWKSNANPWSAKGEAEWSRYSDVENEIIEVAYQDNKDFALLDDYYLDFAHSVQISNNNVNNQRPVKRVGIDRSNGGRLREERFLSSPIHPKAPFYFHEDHRVRSFFLQETFAQMNFQGWNKKTKIAIVEQAVCGLIEEGKIAGKQREAEWMANELLKVKEDTLGSIWKCCIRLYTMESFLYKKLNEIMRLAGSEDKHDKILWQRKIPTLGPFACLMCSRVPESSGGWSTSATMSGVVYRGAHFTDEMIALFRAASENGACQSFEAFTSCSRNRAKAEQFGNTILIMNIVDRNADASLYSIYPNEEEQLLDPGFAFKVEKVELDGMTNKFYIYVQQLSYLDKSVNTTTSIN